MPPTHQPSSILSTTSDASNAAHPSPEHKTQYPKQTHIAPESATFNEKQSTRHSIRNSSENNITNSSLDLYSHDSQLLSKSCSSSESPHSEAEEEPIIIEAELKPKLKNKSSRNCLGDFDFTYGGLYVSGSKYGRKTLGTGTGAAGSGECDVM